MHYPDEPGRFAKLLLRLPALRSIGLKCLEHLFFFKLIGDTPIDTFLLEMLESPSPSSTWLWSSIPPCVLKRVWRCISSKYCRSNSLLCFKPCILLMGLCTNSDIFIGQKASCWSGTHRKSVFILCFGFEFWFASFGGDRISIVLNFYNYKHTKFQGLFI